jgi:Flp pilus assembly protein CpaB
MLSGRPPRQDTNEGARPSSVALSARVPPGQVATALRVSRSEGVAGALRPGDTIDVLMAFTDRASGVSPTTRVLMREKLVYAVALEGDVQSVTLVMPPEEALLLQDALQVGARPYLVLRSAAGLGGAEAPFALSDEALSAWIGRLTGRR